MIVINEDFCAGRIDSDSEDFYWDTRFRSKEEAEEWGSNHDCTHIYDSSTDKFCEIGKNNWFKR